MYVNKSGILVMLGMQGVLETNRCSMSAVAAGECEMVQQG